MPRSWYYRFSEAVAGVPGLGFSRNLQEALAFVENLNSTVTDAPGGGGTPNPGALPLAANCILTQDWIDEYDALGVDAESAGYTYTDPASGVTVIKCTDSTWPTATSSYWKPVYTSAGPCISLPWGAGDNMRTIYFHGDTPSLTGYFIDVNISTGAVSNGRAAPAPAPGNVTINGPRVCFSYNTDTPQICYILDSSGTRLHRWDTDTDSAAPTGNFPWSVSAGEIKNIKNDVDDDWFVAYLADYSGFVLWSDSGGSETAKTSVATNDALFHRGGDYVLIAIQGNNNMDVYDRVANNYNGTSTRAPGDHIDVVGQSLLGVNNGGGGVGVYTINLDTDAETQIYTSAQFTQADYFGGGWALSNPNVYALANQDGSVGVMSETGQRAISIIRADGTDDRRHLAHSYNHNPTQDYSRREHPTWSGDGKLVMFASNMNQSDGSRRDVFLAVMPTS